MTATNLIYEPAGRATDAPLCKCGCSNPVKMNRDGKFNIYIHAHNAKGKPKSPEHRLKLSQAHKGKPGPWQGKTMPIEARQKMSLAAKCRTVSPEHRSKISLALKGRPHTWDSSHPQSIETRMKQRLAHLGSKGSGWKGGVSPANEIIRQSLDFRLWRIAVFRRDHFTCQQCGAKRQNGQRFILHAHHIKPFATFTELRFCVDNGIALCESCHIKIHKVTKEPQS